jgi:hypothetical protein
MGRSLIGIAVLGLALCGTAFLGVALTFELEPLVGFAGGAAATGAVLLLLTCLIPLMTRLRYFRPPSSTLVESHRPVTLLRTMARDEPFLVLGTAVLIAIIEIATGGRAPGRRR